MSKACVKTEQALPAPVQAYPLSRGTNQSKSMTMSHNEKTIHEEAKRQSEKLTDNVNIYDPFSSGVNPRTKSRTLHRRKGTWMVRCSGYWCELTGVKVQVEDPRVVVFETEPRDSYR